LVCLRRKAGEASRAASTRNAIRALGRAIREARETPGLSQERCGELAGLHRNEIGALERGEKNISFINVLRVCLAVQRSPGDLLSAFTLSSLRRLPAKRSHTLHREK
jgi:transcriptional regulator with XRE-family HTH domain